MVMKKGLLAREVARAVDKRLRAGSVVSATTAADTILIRLSLKASSRMTVDGIATRLARLVRKDRLRYFVKAPIPHPTLLGKTYRVDTRRFSLRVTEYYNIVSDGHYVWFDVLGMREKTHG